MYSVETLAQIDHNGQIHLESPLHIRDKRVKIVLYFLEDDDIGEEEWLHTSRSPAFDYLYDPADDIYTLEDGKPLSQ